MDSATQKTIVIIGAGPTGLAALKAVLDTPQCKAGLWKPIVFEARGSVGGVWLPEAPSKPDVPPATPLYDSLTTNLPHPLMCYSEFPFPPSTPVFPKASVVHAYLESYASHFGLKPYIMFNHPVNDLTHSSESSQWRVKSPSLTIQADLVMVCNGHYGVPRYPSTPGISDWLAKGKASHSMWYRHPPDPKLGWKTVLIIGAGPSGQDLTSDFLEAGYTVIHSTTGSPNVDLRNSKLKNRPRIKEYDPGFSTVTFEDGTQESNIDHCYLATGYEYSYPFLSRQTLSLKYPQPIPPLPTDLSNSTFSLFPLAQHIWPIQQQNTVNGVYPPTSLAFLGLLSRVSPLPLVQIQAKAVLHTFAHPQTLDLTVESVEIMNRYQELRGQLWGSSQVPSDLEQDENEAREIYKAWHRFEPMEQYDYRDHLSRMINLPDRVPDWHREMYEQKGLLRKTWVALEKSGEADEWVRGVGEGGKQEWVDLLRRLVERGQEDEKKYKDTEEDERSAKL
ncbi:hypothetical protein MD484_g5611, partial [Candolleomyces efflorescens]